MLSGAKCAYCIPDAFAEHLSVKISLPAAPLMTTRPNDVSLSALCNTKFTADAVRINASKSTAPKDDCSKRMPDSRGGKVY
jgi:hypothetical protein